MKEDISNENLKKMITGIPIFTMDDGKKILMLMGDGSIQEAPTGVAPQIETLMHLREEVLMREYMERYIRGKLGNVNTPTDK